ncbi:MAG: methionyl-tRNA formyltransferase [Actinobacteria bacterium]|nr:methionyl-tRNA formyltransferase [Actinomycetota bacterium]
MYLGTPDVAVSPLEALHAAGFDITLVVTGADRRRGRGNDLTPTPVKAAAERLAMPVSHDLDDIATCGAELGVVVAYGRLIPADLLAILPMVNLHFSLLPRWRGAAPVERAILAGDEQTGVCVMAVDEGLDTGGVYARKVVEVGDDTAAALRSRLAATGSTLLVDTLSAGLGDADPQEGEATYAHRIGAADLRLEWDRPAAELARVVRIGGAWTTFRGERIRVWDAAVAEVDSPVGSGTLEGDIVATGDGGLRLLEVQAENRRRMPTGAWRSGARPEPGERLG